MVDFKARLKDKANVAYMVMGYPNMRTSKAFLKDLDKSSIDILELGVPYSDPIADGDIIAQASLEALNKGANIHAVFEALSEIKTQKILVFLVYYNILFSYGLEKFVKKAKEVRIQGLIVPDLITEENEALFEICRRENIALIGLVSVTTPKERIAKILEKSSGFVYAVASIGITGGKQANQRRLKELVKNIKAQSNLPVFLGFGIKNHEDVLKAKAISDGAIVGTSIVALFKEHKVKEIYKKIKEIF